MPCDWWTTLVNLWFSFSYEVALYRLESALISIKIILLIHTFSIHTSTINFQDKGIMKSVILLCCQVKYQVTTKPARSVLEHDSSTRQRITYIPIVALSNFLWKDSNYCIPLNYGLEAWAFISFQQLFAPATKQDQRLYEIGIY